MAFGGFGTPGGFGATYPMRDMAQTPNSDVVTWTPDAKRFEADWQRRWGAIDPNKTVEAQLVTGAAGYDAALAEPWKQQIFDQATTQNMLGAGVAQDAITPEVLKDYQQKVGGADNFFAFSGNPYGSGFNLGGSYDGGANTGVSHTVQTQVSDPNAYDGLIAEMQAMQPLFQNQAVQQSAYNSMNGNNQLNGILGPNYSDPTFGQVTNNPGLAQGTLDAIMGRQTQTSGAYDPSMSSAGVYGAPRR